jgi:hypothetical protein
MRTEKDISNFLQETEYCDFKHPLIQKTVQEIIKEEDDNQTKAVKFFYWVRDNIFYSVGNWQCKASETLRKRRGTCTNSANLLVAFLRVSKIPAGYGVMKVYGQKYFGPVVIPSLRKLPNRVSTHVYTMVYLNGKWIRCDSSDDKTLSESTFYINPQSKLVEWDGQKDAMLNLNPDDVLEDHYPVADIDPWMKKKSKHVRGVNLKVGNLFVEFLRENSQLVKVSEELEIPFKKWLRKNYPLYYHLFFITSIYRDFKQKYSKHPFN